MKSAESPHETKNKTSEETRGLNLRPHRNVEVEPKITKTAVLCSTILSLQYFKTALPTKRCKKMLICCCVDEIMFLLLFYS